MNKISDEIQVTTSQLKRVCDFLAIYPADVANIRILSNGEVAVLTTFGGAQTVIPKQVIA